MGVSRYRLHPLGRMMRLWDLRHLFGLPLRPMLVHLPLAFWLSVPVFDLLAICCGAQPQWGLAVGASVLLAGCATLYSEDMQHGQVFDDRITIRNPFAAL